MNIVDRIREQLEKQDGLSAEAMEPLALAYGAEVAQLNERLSTCAGLLRKGLRSEALQQANIRPNLFDWSASLDFVELDDWLGILQFFHIPQPPRIHQIAVQQLNEALVEEQPLENLLRQHRRLAIGKAPLAWRLKVLRGIAKLDTNNGFWSEDVEVWERARLQEIPAELARATEAKDGEACERLAAELTQTSWLVAPPAALIKEATQRVAQFEYANQCEQLRSIGSAMYDCFAEQNEAACRHQHANWQTITGQLKQPIPNDLYQQVEPALLWLQELDQQHESDEAHSRHVAGLIETLDQRSSVLDIQNAHRMASSSGDLDASLESRYRVVVAELSLTAKRRSMLSIASIAAVALLALGAFGMWQWRSMRQAKLESTVASLTQMLGDGKLPEAQQFLGELQATQASLVSSPQIAALASDLAGRVQQEAQRVEAFDKYLAQADQEQAQAIDLSLLVKAEELARSESEKEQVHRVRRRKQSYDREVQAEQFASLRESLNNITAELDTLEKRSLPTLAATDFDNTLQKLDELERRWPLAGSEGQRLHATVKKRATSMRGAIFQANMAARNEAQGFKAIRNATSLGRLRQALESFCATNPNASVTAEFKEAIGEQPQWAAVERWNEFAQQLSQYVVKPTPQQAKDILAALQTLKADVELEELLVLCPDVEDRLKSFVRRPEVLDAMRQQLDQDYMSALVTLEGTSNSDRGAGVMRAFTYAQQIDEQRLDLSKAPANSQHGIEIINGVDGTVGLATFLGPVTIIDEPKQTFENLISTSKLHEQELLDQWETQFLLQVNELINQRSLDPIFKEVLIAQTIQSGCEGSDYLKQSLKSVSDLLEQRKSRERNWYRLHKAEDTLESALFTELKSSCSHAYRGVPANHLHLQHLGAAKLVFAGALARDSGGKLEIWLSSATTPDGKLLVARATGANADSVRLESVGQIENGNVALATSALGQLAGRPVFLMANN